MAKPKKEFTATEVMMLQEEIRKGVEVIGEQYGDIKKEITVMRQKLEKLDKIEEGVTIIKASLPLKANKTELDKLDQRVTILESKAL